MTLSFRINPRRRIFAASLLLSTIVVQALGQAAAPAAARLSGLEAELAEKITVSNIKEMTAALAAPEMEGRGTGQPGGDKAAA